MLNASFPWRTHTVVVKIYWYTDTQVAHQLLNGRPAIRGLRRQFSLDQGSNYYVTPVSSKSVISRMPYSEETLGEHFVTITPAQVASSSSSLEKSGSTVVVAADTTLLHQAKSLDSATPSTSGNSSGTLPDNNEHPGSSSKFSRLSPRSIKTFVKSSSLPVVEESIEQSEPK